ncbi:hypothetical protein FSP39_016015 [Pinctada imbricata]|uniref:Uncharacterized protein n=1 Tax=Pinctada imbricata TaxID=66713 RepID=A0AA89BKM4_PINIB|nr:hypothetical protein FSP39_016015 [Pinctada imbricata]
MTEQLRRMEKERKLKEHTKKSSKSKLLTKEFSAPVKAANALIARRKDEEIARDEKLTKMSQFKYDRECDSMTELRKNLASKLKDFDADEFHKEHVDNRKSCSFKISSKDVISMMMNVPQNCVLDFGPGNKIVHTFDPALRRLLTSKSEKFLKRPKQPLITPTKPSWQRKDIKSKYSKYFRAQSARQPRKTADDSKDGGKVRPQTSMARLNRSYNAEFDTPRGQVVNRKSNLDFNSPRGHKLKRSPSELSASHATKSIVKFNNFTTTKNETESDTGSTVSSKSTGHNRCKSYRILRDMYTYKEEDELPLPDPKEEFMKKCKNMESINYRMIEKRINAFLEQMQ